MPQNKFYKVIFRDNRVLTVKHKDEVHYYRTRMKAMLKFDYFKDMIYAYGHGFKPQDVCYGHGKWFFNINLTKDKEHHIMAVRLEIIKTEDND